jgi:hypothetical protein
MVQPEGVDGGIVSTTDTGTTAFVELPDASVAEQLSDVTPRANIVPDAGAHVTVGELSTTSTAEAVNVTIAPLGLVASAVGCCGGVSVGAVVSRTVTENVTELLLPLASVAMHRTVVAPSAKVVPEAGEHATVGFGSTLSLAVGFA